MFVGFMFVLWGFCLFVFKLFRNTTLTENLRAQGTFRVVTLPGHAADKVTIMSGCRILYLRS